MPRSRQRPAVGRHQRLLAQGWELVTPIAQRYAKASPEPLDDLVQEGLLGLLTAAAHYSRAEQVPFDCFARPHIRGAILHHLRDRAWLVRLPRRQAERQQKLRQLGGTAGLAAPDGGEVLRRWSALVRPACLEELAGAGMALDGAEPLEPGAAGGEEGGYRPQRLHPSWEGGTAEQMLALIQPRQQRVLRCVVLEGWSYRRTASAMQVSAATVQRLLHKGLAQLRQQLQQAQVSYLSPHRGPSAA